MIETRLAAKRARMREWYAKLPDDARQKMASRSRNKQRNDQQKEAHRLNESKRNRACPYANWSEDRKAKHRARRQKRRALLRNCTGSYSAQEWLYLVDKHGNVCLKCGRSEPEIKLSPDHVVPLSRGGSNGIDNIQPLCGFCNRSKGDKTVDYRLPGVEIG